MTDAERLCWLFLIIPFAGYVLAEAVTNSFYNRYLITMLPGVAVAFACLASRRLNRLATMALLLLMTAGMGWRQIQTAKNAELIDPPSIPAGQQAFMRQTLAAEDALVADGRKIIITHFLMLYQAQYYSKRPQLYAMYGSEDPNPLFCKYFGSACLDLDGVKARVKEVAAIYPVSDKLVADMTQAGFQMKIVHPPVAYFSPR